MYCASCGKNEPEIKLNNKLYCSHCGLPLEKPETVKSEKQSENTDELHNAFSEMRKSLDKNEGGSYRSGNIKVIERVKEELVTKDEKKEETYDLEIPKPPEKDKITLETLEISLPSKNNIISFKSNKDTFSPPEETSFLEENLEIPLPPQNDKTDSLQEKKPKETVEFDEQKTPKVETFPKKFDDFSSNNNSKILEKTSQDVKELGAASKLIDILEEDVREKEVEAKIQKTRKFEKVFTKLIDILNQPVPSPEPIKHTNKNKAKNKKDPIHDSFESLMSQKEIGSPLDELEIETPKEEKENIELEIPVPDQDSYEILEQPLTIPTPPEEPETSIPFQTPQEDFETPLPIPTPPKETEEPLELEMPSDIDIEIEKKQNIEKEKPVSINLGREWKFKRPKKNKINEEKEEKPKEEIEEDVDLASIEKEIHAFGDKSGHIDHWPEEEVLGTAPEQTKLNTEKHPLTSFMREIVGHKSKVKKKKNKKKKRNNFIKILTAFIISFVFLGATLYIINFYSKEAIINQEEILKKATFNVSLPNSIPSGYKIITSPKISNNDVEIIYTYQPDKSKTITLREAKIEPNFILEDYVNGKQGTFLSEKTDNKVYYFINEKEITWTNDNIWYIIEKNEKSSIEELREIAESF